MAWSRPLCALAMAVTLAGGTPVPRVLVFDGAQVVGACSVAEGVACPPTVPVCDPGDCSACPGAGDATGETTCSECVCSQCGIGVLAPVVVLAPPLAAPEPGSPPPPALTSVARPPTSPPPKFSPVNS